LNLSKDIISALAYFDIFKYPLTQLEIFQFLQHQYKYDDYLKCLNSLITDGHIFQIEKFYSLNNDHTIIERRKAGNLKAKRLLNSAEKVAKLLFYFPFVRGIAISGSLSKNYADEHSDIDLFIIASRNRLWIARTIMHCFKKLTFLVKKQHFFCMNYYIDEGGLTIEEKNIYTATEIVTLLPLNGRESFLNFYLNNNWTRSYLPNHSMKVSYQNDLRHPIFKKVTEFLLSNKLGDNLDHFLMKITSKRWNNKSKKGKLNSKGILLGMKADKHYAKPDPRNFQERLLIKYQDKVFQLSHDFEKAQKQIF
jgi:hypothetical protein